MAIVPLFRHLKNEILWPSHSGLTIRSIWKKIPDSQPKSSFMNLCILFLVPSSLTMQNVSTQHDSSSDACRHLPFLQIKKCRAFNHSSLFFFLHPLSSSLMSFDMFLFLNSLLKTLGSELDAILSVAYLLSVIYPTENREELRILFI